MFQKLSVVVLSVAALAIGLWGIARLSMRPAVPFTWKNRAGRVFIQESSPPDFLAEGDVLLKLNQIPLRRGEEIEFILDGKRIGEVLSATILRQGKEISVPVVLGIGIPHVT